MLVLASAHLLIDEGPFGEAFLSNVTQNRNSLTEQRAWRHAASGTLPLLCLLIAWWVYGDPQAVRWSGDDRHPGAATLASAEGLRLCLLS